MIRFHSRTLRRCNYDGSHIVPVDTIAEHEEECRRKNVEIIIFGEQIK